MLNEDLKTRQEPGNPEYRFAVSVYKEGTLTPTIGHLPKEISGTSCITMGKYLAQLLEIKGDPLWHRVDWKSLVSSSLSANESISRNSRNYYNCRCTLYTYTVVCSLFDTIEL